METSHLTEVCTLQLSENKVLTKIFGWEKLQHKEFIGFAGYSWDSIIYVMVGRKYN
jgi:hypothetical protein